MSDVQELLKRQEDLEAMIQAQNERFATLQKKKTQVCTQIVGKKIQKTSLRYFFLS